MSTSLYSALLASTTFRCSNAFRTTTPTRPFRPERPSPSTPSWRTWSGSRTRIRASRRCAGFLPQHGAPVWAFKPLRTSGMVIGLLQFELVIHGSESLKDKRRVVRSVKDRLHREHMVAVAEVASQEVLNLAVLGLACVGSDGAR